MSVAIGATMRGTAPTRATVVHQDTEMQPLDRCFASSRSTATVTGLSQACHVRQIAALPLHLGSISPPLVSEDGGTLSVVMRVNQIWRKIGRAT